MPSEKLWILQRRLKLNTRLQSQESLIFFSFQSLQASKYEDWYWKFQVGKCYFKLGMYRDAEKMFKSALKQQEMIDLFLHLARVRCYNIDDDRFLIDRLFLSRSTFDLISPWQLWRCIERVWIGSRKRSHY